MEHRESALAQLRGNGLEIGAMHNPTPLPAGCRMKYFDVATRAEAMAMFPELPPESFRIDPDYLGDLDRGGLDRIPDGAFDFVILNHVIEHVANPIRVVAGLFRVVRAGGRVLIACPDKRFTFDRGRDLTTFAHLQDEYEAGVERVSDAHYLDFLAKVHPEVMTSPDDLLALHVAGVRQRREHAHVWDSASFRDFLERAFAYLRIRSECLYEAAGDANQFEHFSVWRRCE